MEHRFLMKKERRFLMEQISITFTSNTGLLMQYGDTKVLFDSLYGKSGHRFSPLPQVLEQEIMEGAGDFSEIDYLVFSHNHADHFSAKYLKAYLQQNTVKGIFLPEDLLQETDLMVIRETINPKEVFVYHIPFDADDVLSMRKMVKRDCDKWDSCPVTPLWEPMQRECRAVDRG